MAKLKFTKASNAGDLQKYTTSEYQKWNISTTTDFTILQFLTLAMMFTIASNDYDLHISIVEYLSNPWFDQTQVLNSSIDGQPKFTNASDEEDLQWKKQPQTIKSGISHQPLMGSYSSFKLKRRWSTKLYKCFKWRQPPVEDEIKDLSIILAVYGATN